MFSPMGPFMTELYPTAVRGIGQGFCYNAGRGIGALFPALVGFLAIRLGLGPAIAVFSLAAFGMMIVALLHAARDARALVAESGATGGRVASGLACNSPLPLREGVGEGSRPSPPARVPRRSRR